MRIRKWIPLLLAATSCSHGGAAARPGGNLPPGKPAGFDLLELPSKLVDASKFPKAPKTPYRPRGEGARVWFVAPGGDGSGDAVESPRGDLRRVVDDAGKGDVIWVKGGTYKVGSADDEFALRIKQSGLTVAAWPGQRAVIEPAQEGLNYGVEITGDDVIFDGFDVRGFGQGGVFFGRLKDPQKNLVIARVTVDGGIDGVRSAVRAGRSKTPVISGLLLYDVQILGAAIGFNCGEGPCNDVRLEKVRVDGRAEDSSGEGGSSADAIAFEAGENVAVVDSEVKNVGADGYDLKVKHALLYASTVRGVGRNGIKLWYDGDVINCLVYGTGADAAVVFDRGGNYRVLHTTVARHGHRGEAYSLVMAYDHPKQPGKLEIANSIFWENAGPIWVSGKTELSVVNTLLSKSKGGAELVWAKDPEVRIAKWEDAKAIPGSRGVMIGADPKFRDPDQGDYRLKPGSPAVDQGSNLETMPTHDLAGAPRKIGERPDLGPYELVPAKD